MNYKIVRYLIFFILILLLIFKVHNGKKTLKENPSIEQIRIIKIPLMRVIFIFIVIYVILFLVSFENHASNYKLLDFTTFTTFGKIEIEDKDSMAIQLTSPIINNEKYEIRDSLDSKVYSYYLDNYQNSFIIINKKIDKNKYKIFINDKEYKPLK